MKVYHIMNLREFINKLKTGSIHVIGVTGAEGSSILNFLVKHGLAGVTTVHDYIPEEEVEKNFKLWHKGINEKEKDLQYQTFRNNLSRVKGCFGMRYLEGIDTSSAVFVPQSWRLYRERNNELFYLVSKVSFYSITRLYLEYAPAQVVGITGTVGKGSTANLLYQILNACGKRVYFTGNETWTVQLADKIDEMKKSDHLILEISHRQLLDGIEKSPGTVIYTNVYPNHLDELSWEEYKEAKKLLAMKQKRGDAVVFNAEDPVLSMFSGEFKSMVYPYSALHPEKNLPSVRKIMEEITIDLQGNHYQENILAAVTASCVLGVDSSAIIRAFREGMKPLHARLEKTAFVEGISFYDDLKSTTPWATMKALEHLGKKTVLICGGNTKGIDYGTLSEKIKSLDFPVVVLESELSEILKRKKSDIITVNSLTEAVHKAYGMIGREGNILLSPGAAFFYTQYISGKKSFRRIVSNLVLKDRPV